MCRRSKLGGKNSRRVFLLVGFFHYSINMILDLSPFLSNYSSNTKHKIDFQQIFSHILILLKTKEMISFWHIVICVQ